MGAYAEMRILLYVFPDFRSRCPRAEWGSAPARDEQCRLALADVLDPRGNHFAEPHSIVIMRFKHSGAIDNAAPRR
jgi:hypothetical protein